MGDHDGDGDEGGDLDWLIGVALSLVATLGGTVGKVMMKLAHNRADAAAALAAANAVRVLSAARPGGGAGKDILGARKGGADGGAAPGDASDEDGGEDGAYEYSDGAPRETYEQAKAAMSAKALKAELKQYRSGLLFYTGLFLNVVVNPVGYALAYNFASQSLIVPLSALAIVFNTLMAPAVLGEELSKEDWYGAAVIFGGAVLVGVGADRSEQDHEPEDIREFYEQGLFLAFLAAQVIWLVFLAVYMLAPEPETDDEEEPAEVSLYRKLAWGSAGGTLGGNQYFIKSAVVYLEHGVFDDALAWVTYIGAIASALLGLVLLNAGLHRYDAVYVVPMYQSFLILFGTASAMTFFREFENMDDWQWAVWSPGVALTIVGILIISLHFNCFGLWASSEDDADAEERAERAERAALELQRAPSRIASVARSVPGRNLDARRPASVGAQRLSMRMDYTMPGGLTPTSDARSSFRRKRRLSARAMRSQSFRLGTRSEVRPPRGPVALGRAATDGDSPSPPPAGAASSAPGTPAAPPRRRTDGDAGGAGRRPRRASSRASHGVHARRDSEEEDREAAAQQVALEEAAFAAGVGSALSTVPGSGASMPEDQGSEPSAGGVADAPAEAAGERALPRMDSE